MVPVAAAGIPARVHPPVVEAKVVIDVAVDKLFLVARGGLQHLAELVRRTGRKVFDGRLPVFPRAAYCTGAYSGGTGCARMHASAARRSPPVPEQQHDTRGADLLARTVYARGAAVPAVEHGFQRLLAALTCRSSSSHANTACHWAGQPTASASPFSPVSMQK